ncbi:MAG: HAMP domain-containing sensor histidine kinase [Planctomycetota bacterium]
MESRYGSIRQALAAAHYPLNATVLASLADLTQTDLITIDKRGEMLVSTLDVALARDLTQDIRKEKFEAGSRSLVGGKRWGGKRWVAYEFAMSAPELRADRVDRVLVFFDEGRQREARNRAAWLPAVTGLSTIAAFSLVWLWLSSHLVGRISRLRLGVEAVARGNFHSKIATHGVDEIDDLGQSVNTMSMRLDQLVKQVQRQEGEQLLHQVSAGLAHQLRNSLTGARMAVELHRRDSQAGGDESDEELEVAIQQIESAEETVRRLVTVAAGEREAVGPSPLEDRWQVIQNTLVPIAKHLGVGMDWVATTELKPYVLPEAEAWSAAATNLITNAIQAGQHVTVTIGMKGQDRVQLDVVDDGEGLAPEIATEAFEPFVTTKPEGLGLGLAVVRRTASRLGGTVDWWRQNGSTVFRLTVPAQALNDKSTVGEQETAVQTFHGTKSSP